VTDGKLSILELIFLTVQGFSWDFQTRMDGIIVLLVQDDV